MRIDGYLDDPWLMRLIRNGKEWNTIGIVIENIYDLWMKESSTIDGKNPKLKHVVDKKFIDEDGQVFTKHGKTFTKEIRKERTKLRMFYECGFGHKTYNYNIIGVPSDLYELHIPRELLILKGILFQTCFLQTIGHVYSKYGGTSNEDKDLVVMLIDNTRTCLDFEKLMEIYAEYDKRIHVMTTLNVREDGNGNKIMVRIPAEVIRDYEEEWEGLKGVEHINNILNKPFKKEDAESNCCDSVETINK